MLLINRVLTAKDLVKYYGVTKPTALGYKQDIRDYFHLTGRQPITILHLVNYEKLPHEMVLKVLQE